MKIPNLKKFGIFLVLVFNYFYSQDFKLIPPPDYIKTVRLFNPQTNTNQAIIKLGDYLILSFDELKPSYVTFSYKIKRFERDWKESNLFNSEYIIGYFSGNITNFSPSFNTLVKYTHYEVPIPNDKLTITKSGNYAVYVYGKDKQKPLFTMPFIVIEPLVEMGIQVDRINSKGNVNYQKVNVTAFSNNFDFNSNYNSISLTIYQNNNLFLSNIKPQFSTQNKLTFSQLTNVFDAQNEFYSFDTKNLLINGLTTEKIIQNDPIETYLYLIEPYPEMYDGYFEDINGDFFIRRNDLGIEKSNTTDADYTKVFFGLKSKELLDKEIYVVGMFNNYQLTEENKLKYNENGYYECMLLLKQGYYNYTFVTKDIINNKLNYSELNGSFWETKNLYQAILYWTPWGKNYDLAIGFGEGFSNFY